ncbi:MAG: hypothetical protein L3J37_05495 [Rhodobacteraceae bacterium]|nr:hypothetical protein [Paracoccaceae bacterium]
MTKDTKNEPLSRRKMLGRIGMIAAASYTIPAFTTLSAAQAGSNSSSNSGSSNSGPSNSGPSNSGPSNSGPSNSGPSNSGPSNSGPSGAEGGPVTDTDTAPTRADLCGTENLDDPNYLQCLLDNGFVE